MNLLCSLILREFMSRPRRRRFHVKRVMFVFCGGIVALAGFALGGAAGSSATGLYLFRTLAISSLIATCLLATLSSASAFVRERNEGTLGLLFLTDITNGELLLSRLWTTLFFTAVAALSILPMFVMMVGLGGVVTLQIVAAYALLFCAAFLGNCTGLVVSCIVNTERGIQALASLAFCLVFLALPGISFLFCSLIGVPCGFVLGIVSPFRAMMYAIDVRTMEYSILNCFFNLALGILFLLVAQEIFCRRRDGSEWLSVRQEKPRPETTRSRIARKKTRAVKSSNPLTWRDLNFSYGNRGAVRFVLWLSYGLAMMCVCVGYLAFGGPANRALFAAIGFVMAGVSAISAIIFLLGSVFYCSQAFSREKRLRLLELLFITDLSIDEIFLGKLIAVFRTLMPYMICAVMTFFPLLVFCRRYTGFLTVGFFIDYLSMCFAYPLLALSLAFRFRRFVALGICVSVFILWNVVGRLLIILLLFKTNVTTAGFLVDFAFHVELILIGSILIDRWFKGMAQGGATWVHGDEIVSK